MVIKHVERRVRLSDSHIKKLRQKDKLFSVGDSEVPGLRIYVETSGTKIHRPYKTYNYYYKYYNPIKTERTHPYQTGLTYINYI